MEFVFFKSVRPCQIHTRLYDKILLGFLPLKYVIRIYIINLYGTLIIPTTAPVTVLVTMISPDLSMWATCDSGHTKP